MRLESELKATGCGLDVTIFRDSIADLWSAMNRDCSIDNFLCRPWDHREFCSVVRYRLGLDETADDLVLRTLLNMRKRGREGTGYGPSARVRLSTEIESLSLEVDAGVFRDTVRSIFLDVYKAFTVDQLLMRWRDSLHFCALVRSELDLPKSLGINELVLRTLLNSRRRAKLSLRDRVAA